MRIEISSESVFSWAGWWWCWLSPCWRCKCVRLGPGCRWCLLPQHLFPDCFFHDCSEVIFGPLLLVQELVQGHFQRIGSLIFGEVLVVHYLSVDMIEVVDVLRLLHILRHRNKIVCIHYYGNELRKLCKIGRIADTKPPL